MLAVLVPIASQERFDRFAAVGIERLLRAHPDTLVLTHAGDTFQRAANTLLDFVAEHRDVEAALVIHEDVEFTDLGIVERTRERFADPRNAVLGAVGSSGSRGLAWWNGCPAGGSVTPLAPYPEVAFHSGFQYVDYVDGLLLALSPWAIRHLRFDERFAPRFHGYDADLCLQAQAHGRGVLVDDITITHHAVDGLRDGREADWMGAHVDFVRHWELGPARPGERWMRGAGEA